MQLFFRRKQIFYMPGGEPSVESSDIGGDTDEQPSETDDAKPPKGYSILIHIQ